MHYLCHISSFLLSKNRLFFVTIKERKSLLKNEDNLLFFIIKILFLFRFKSKIDKDGGLL